MFHNFVYIQLIRFMLDWPVDFSRYELYCYFGAAKYFLSEWLEMSILYEYLFASIKVCPVVAERWPHPLESHHIAHLRQLVCQEFNLQSAANLLVRMLSILGPDHEDMGWIFNHFWQMGLPKGRVLELVSPSPRRRGAYVTCRVLIYQRFLYDRQCPYCHETFSQESTFHLPQPTFLWLPCCHSVAHVRCTVASIAREQYAASCSACGALFKYSKGNPLGERENWNDTKQIRQHRKMLLRSKPSPPLVYGHILRQRPYKVLDAISQAR